MAPSQGSSGVQNSDWRNIGFGDGFNAFADPSDKNIVYSEWQNGKLLRFYKNTGELKSVSPFPKPASQNIVSIGTLPPHRPK